MTNNTETRGAGSQRPRMTRLALAAAAVLVAAVGAVYGIAGSGGNASGGACADARAAAERIKPLARGEIAALTIAADPRPAPTLAFQDEAGARKTLADWNGRTVLLNLWATWCVPCRQEMPALDALQAKLGTDRFEVVTVNIDTRDAAKPKAWLRAAGIQRLAYFADPSAKTFQDLKAAGKAFGMPTTLLIAPSGCEIASLAGPAEWASDDAVKLVQAALAQ
jgi:thiol-disulfide isomerase/thioredoxin